ncbi:MAG: hypothetical protein ABJB05_05900 [Parafilimonas sp.]
MLTTHFPNSKPIIMTRSWIFLMNPFISVTNTSYRLMKQIGDYTLAAIAARMPQNAPANAEATATTDIFTQLFAILSPVVQAYDDAYTTWLSQQGTVKGQTKSLNDVLDLLSSQKIEDWDLAIQNVYRQHTPQYMALLPRHRTPFQHGSQQDKITAVGALSLAIGTDGALQTLKTDVDAFHDTLVNANAVQKGSKSTKSGNSTEVEADRIALGIELYGALGLLMQFYKKTPETIADIVPVDALRTHEQTLFKQDINGGEVKLVFTRKLEEDDHIKITDRGNTALQFALVPEKNDAMPAGAFTVQPNEAEVVTPAMLGAAGNRFLIVKNINATEKGSFTIELV